MTDSRQHKTLLILLFVVFLFAGCSGKKRETPIEDNELVLGTFCSVRIWGSADRDLLAGSFKILHDIEDWMSPGLLGSDLFNLKENAGIKPVQIHPDTMFVIERGLHYYEVSNGYLDISIGPLVSLWDINSENPHVPEQTEIDSAMALMGLDEVRVNRTDNTVFLPRKGMALELGAIAKGYASDKVADYLRENGISKALINLGGNVYALGRKSKDKKWAIGIQDPFQPERRGASVGYVSVENKAVISSGPYERKFFENGKRYHHILDPFTGYPVDNNIESITIICDRGIDGDALSTSLFALTGTEAGLALEMKLSLEQGIEVVYITKDKKVYMTPGAEKMYTHLDNSFSVEEIISDTSGS